MSADEQSTRASITFGTMVLGVMLLRGCVVDDISNSLDKLTKASSLSGIERQLDDINYSLSRLPIYDLQMNRENVLGGPAPEEFVLFNGQRGYVSIDGKPVEVL
jgi:hypothetical protein